MLRSGAEEKRKRREREDILDVVERRVAILAEDISLAAEPLDLSWSERRRKVWEDCQKSAKDAPVYLKMNHAIAAAMVKGRNQAPVAQFNVLVLGDGTVPADQWKEKAAALEKQDAIDVKALPPLSKQGSS